MKINEAKEILEENGYILEGIMSLKDKIDNAKSYTDKYQIFHNSECLVHDPFSYGVIVWTSCGTEECEVFTRKQAEKIYNYLIRKEEGTPENLRIKKAY